jgi:hypothetical protein
MTSLGANGIPDKFVEEDLQQPYQLKISIEELVLKVTSLTN